MMMKISNAILRSQVKWKRPEYVDSEGRDIPDEIDVH
jgi:hypothetical protein